MTTSGFSRWRKQPVVADGHTRISSRLQIATLRVLTCRAMTDRIQEMYSDFRLMEGKMQMLWLGKAEVRRLELECESASPVSVSRTCLDEPSIEMMKPQDLQPRRQSAQRPKPRLGKLLQCCARYRQPGLRVS